MYDDDYPDSPVEAIPTDRKDTLQHYKERLQDSKTFCLRAWETAKTNQRFLAGGANQWDSNEYKERTKAKKPTFTMNDIVLAVHGVSGREITARFEPFFEAEDDSDEISQAWAQSLRLWVGKLRSKANALIHESEAFRDLQLDAYSWMGWEHVYDGPPKGRTVCQTYEIWNMVWDRYAKDMNLVDRSWDAHGQMMSIDDYLMLVGKDDLDDAKARINTHKDAWLPSADSRTQRWPWLYVIEAQQYIDPDRRELFVVDYQWRERAPAWVVAVPAGLAPHPIGPEELAQRAEEFAQLDEARWPSELLSLTEEEWEEYQETFPEFAAARGWSTDMPDALTPEDDGSYRWAYKRATIVGGEKKREFEMPFPMFTRQCMVSFPWKEPGGTHRLALADIMSDPQKFKNYVYSIAVAILQRTPKQGLVYGPRVFDDKVNVANELNKPFSLLKAKSNVDLQKELYWMPGVQYPRGLDNFVALADAATWRPTGMNPNTLGGLQDPARVSPSVFDALSEALMVVMGYPFESLRLARRTGAELLAYMTEAYYDESDIIKVVGQKRAQFVPPKSAWRTKMRLNTDIEEVAVARSEKWRGWEYFSRQGTLEKLILAGLAPPWLMPKMIPDDWLSAEDKQEWIAWLQGQLQQQQPVPEGG